ncbi:hypothetical protein [Thermaerobacillus caldiproteolyticus]|uniref:Uncharacterized protein n=1 Tax=Thermaerobacillus caldiproteolyticus TaxID=247480 RepID=A0A7V9Z5A5_9BACL|nr:hypothetical protein [Anoxybacillus caldiproteolyticus]MBA2874297.1 hypothetical protein [Anoxybacillus caldiproteolyticus]
MENEYRITFRLDSIINFDEPFSIEDINFFYSDNVLYAQTTVQSENMMAAQHLAWGKVINVCSGMAYIFQYPLNFYIDKVEELAPDGTINFSMSSIEASLYVRKRISRSNIDDIMKITKLMEQNENVKKVMLLANRPDFKTWRVLSNIYEIIIKGDQKGKLNGWISQHELDLFKHTSNHPEASGLEARHGYLKSQPPENPMKLDEAITLINKLIDKWLNYLWEKYNEKG